MFLSIQGEDIIIPVSDIHGIVAVNIGAITQLTRFTGTPRKDVAIAMKCKAMAAADCNLNDVA